jgi:hypothetical protein
MSIAAHPLYRQLESSYGVPVALPVSRGALGLMVALRIWAKRGRPAAVALCANVCHDVVAAVLAADCRPIFLDLDPVTGLVADDEWTRGREAGASVALVVHLYGNPADVAAARSRFPEGDCLLIDDAAQALGTCVGNAAAGGQGDIGLLSFGATKQIEGGGGALLFRSRQLAEEVAAELSTIATSDAVTRAECLRRFREGLESARRDLRQTGPAAAFAFSGLLDGYTPALVPAFPLRSSGLVLASLRDYAPERAARVEKSRIWREELLGSDFQAVGMDTGAVPWRYTCRVPGIDWNQQHELAEAMRARGLDVSNWYLPGHWLCGFSAGSLPGVERLSQEIFQFWVDAKTSEAKIREHAAIAASIIGRHRD